MGSPTLTTPERVQSGPGAARLLLIVNPEASRVSPRTRAAVLAALSSRHSVEAVSTESARDATRRCREAAGGGYDFVIVFGGDGTVTAAARGLAGTGLPLACIPGGFTNVFSRTLGVPRDPVAAAHRTAALPGRSEPRSIALGALDGEPFLFTAGAGFSAMLMERLRDTAAADGGFGTAHAVRQVAALVGRYIRGEAPAFRIEAESGEAEVVAAMIQNSDPLTFLGPRPLRVSPAVRLGPPGISLTGLRSARLRDVARVAPPVLAGRPGDVVSYSGIAHWPAVEAARVTALDRSGVAVEADGDYLGRRQTVEFGVAEERLLVLA